MMSIDIIGNFLTIIRNGILASRPSVSVPYSQMKHKIADILKKEGFVKDAVVMGEGVEKTIKIFLKYVDGESVIHEITRASKPSRRIYRGAKKLPHVIGGLGIAIVSTSQGIMTNKEARDRSIGGEVVCSVW